MRCASSSGPSSCACSVTAAVNANAKPKKSFVRVLSIPRFYADGRDLPIGASSHDWEILPISVIIGKRFCANNKGCWSNGNRADLMAATNPCAEDCHCSNGGDWNRRGRLHSESEDTQCAHHRT